MEFVKGQARKAAIMKFILLYGLSLIMIIATVYFLFNTPANLFKKSIQQYKLSEAEQNQLLNKTDAITTHINRIIETDHSYELATNVTDKEKLKETLGQYTNEVVTALQDLENDSTNRRFSSKRAANNYLFLFRNFLEYRDAFSNDATAFESRKDLPLLFNRALDSLTTIRLQRESLKNQLASALNGKNVIPVSQTTGNNNVDAAAKAADEKTIDDLQTRLRQSQADLNDCNQQKKALTQNSQSEANNLTQEQMAALLINAGKKLYTQGSSGKNFKGGTIEQRGFFACARQIFEEAKTHSDSPDIDNYLKNIDAQIKKLTY